ncbi:hypothetical protein BDV97DRAFT_402209 [Delphinella strobiligena]|nr:hypothetical protein BDV97DRAFT_402209 [Delphinella strobiligena]
MAAQFAFHRGSSYKMFFTKLDEFHATATNGQKYQLLTDQDYQLRFFDFLCKEYNPHHESTKNQLVTYDAAKLLSAIKDLAGEHRGAQPKIDINGVPRVLMYGISPINTATAKKIKNVNAGPWSATDFGTWDDPAQPRSTKETPIIVEDDASPEQESMEERLRRPLWRAHQMMNGLSRVLIPSLTPKRRKQQTDVSQSDTLQGTPDANLGHQAQAPIIPKDDADPQEVSVTESPGSTKRKRQIDDIVSVVNTISPEPSPSDASKRLRSSRKT